MKAKYNLLDVIPSKADHITTEKEGDLTVIAFSRFKWNWVRRLLLPKRMSPYIRVRLDEHGTAVWESIDGVHSVREIIKLLAQHFAGEEHYHSRITTFITQLQKDGFIKYRIKME